MRVSYSLTKRAGFVSRLYRAEYCVFPGAVIGRLGVLVLILACLLGSLAPRRLQAQNITLAPVITTVAGVGTQGGYFGDGVAATSAALNYPSGVALDRAGNIYFVDSGWSRIRVVNTQTAPITVAGVTIQPGDIATVAGNNSCTYQGSYGNCYSGDGGPATNAELSPTDVALDSAGNIYIADFANSRIRVVNTQTAPITVAGVTIQSGYIATVAGTGTQGYSGDGGLATNALLNLPTGVAVDSAGDIYIADEANHCIRVVNTQATAITVAGVTIQPTYIATVAGTGTAGYNEDGIGATSAELNYPLGVAVDSAANLYIADSVNNRVRKVDTYGIITTVAGNGIPSYSGDGGPATSAELDDPAGLALDSAGNLYIADNDNDRIRKVTKGQVNFEDVSFGHVNFGQVNVRATSTQNVVLFINAALTLFSVQASGDFSVLSNSCALNTSLPANSICTLQVQFTPTKPGQRWFPLVVTDSGSNTYSFGLEGTGVGSALAFTPGIITTVAGNGTFGTSGDTGAATSAELADPLSVALDSAGNFYIAEVYDQRIRMVNTNGIITTIAGDGTKCAAPSNPCGDGGYALSAQLYSPSAVQVDSAGTLFIADYLRIRKVDTNGIITTVAGTGNQCSVSTDPCGDGGPATSAKFSTANDVAVDSAGNLFIADIFDNRIRKVDTNGIITTVAGTGNQCSVSTDSCGDGTPATTAEFNYPRNVVIDSAGNLYISDGRDYRVRKVDTNGIITTIAGDGTQCGGLPNTCGDGGPAIAAEISMPFGLALDAAADLFITDDNVVVRKVDTNGIITTVAGGGSGSCGGRETNNLGDGCPATAAKLIAPTYVAVDGGGNLYISEYENPSIRKVDVTTSVLSFGSLGVGQTSSPQSVAVSDVGNAALNFSSLAASFNFQLQSVGNHCTSMHPLAIGATCALGGAFAPTVPGNALGTLTVADDAFNSPQIVTLSGNGIATPMFSNLTPSPTIPLGASSVSLSGILTAGPYYPPSGETVSITINGQTITTPIGSGGTFSTTFITATALNALTYQIAYSYPGDSSFTSASDSSTSLTVTSPGTMNNVKLTLTELGTGQGNVTDYNLISCRENNGIPYPGNSCSASYSYGTQVTLTESAGSGATFGGWGGACTGTSNQCTVVMYGPQSITANFIPPPSSVQLAIFSQGPGTNVTGVAAFACPTNPNPTPGNPCTDPNGHALKVTIPQVISAFPPNLTVTATEFQADGLCPPGENGQSSDLDCRFVSFYNYGTDSNGNTIVPLCYPYANGNCVHYELAETDGTEPDPSLYSGGVFWKVEFNNETFVPTGYWAKSTPRMLDDPDTDEVPPPVGPLPFGTNCSTPMHVGTPPQQYSPTIYCQFDNDITTFYNPTEPVDAGIGGRTKATNDVVVAFLPTAPGGNPPLLPPSNSIPTITGSCVTGCVLSGNSITFTEGMGGTFAVTPTGFPAPTLTESGTLPSGLRFDATTGLISGTPTAGTAGNSVQFTASNVAGSATQIFSLTVSGLEISQTNVNFGTLYLGQIAAQPITLTNTGTTPITISSIKVTAPGNAVGDYGDITLCTPLLSSLPGTLAAGKSCKIFVGTLAAMKIFSPTASTATLTITDSVAGSPQSVPLTAQVINPRATLSANSLTFRGQKMGTTSGAKSVTVTNTGNTPLILRTLTISGNFALTSGTTCSSNGGTVAAGASCVVNVTFTPTAKGTRTGSVQITDNALSSPQFIWLSGTGN